MRKKAPLFRTYAQPSTNISQASWAIGRVEKTIFVRDQDLRGRCKRLMATFTVLFRSGKACCIRVQRWVCGHTLSPPCLYVCGFVDLHCGALCGSHNSSRGPETLHSASPPQSDINISHTAFFVKRGKRELAVAELLQWSSLL